MSITKLQRHKKRQLGQFLTPTPLAADIVKTIPISKEQRVLEPSMGDGSFIIPLIERFLGFYKGSIESRLSEVLNKNIWGIELDEELYQKCLNNIKERWNYLPNVHNLIEGDFFKSPLLKDAHPLSFDVVIGNPPFGGSFDPVIEDYLDSIYGMRNGNKIKKETYAFFIVKSTDMLKKDGTLVFICSDTFLTINTMRGLRAYLMDNGDITIERLNGFSEETTHPMVILRYVHKRTPGVIVVDKQPLPYNSVIKTDNLSFGLKPEFEKYFVGPRMGDFFIATSGMTTGKNEYFVREIQDGFIEEPYTFSFSRAPIQYKEELKKARLGKLSAKVVEELLQQEADGETRRVLHIEKAASPQKIKLPDARYQYYNKAVNSIIYSPPHYVIFWENDGEAVLTYKKNGNWYLRGVGGQPYFRREGITWQLIASRMHMRYLPTGYILDSGAPCAFPRGNTPKDEIFFALGWALSRQCNTILKEVINHTKNIQGKDFERLPYPFWVTSFNKRMIISLVKDMVAKAKREHTYTYESSELLTLESLFTFSDNNNRLSIPFIPVNKCASLF